MSFIEVKQVDKSVEVSFARSPVNALNLPLLIELHNFLDNIPATTNLIIFSGGNSKFFSFGLDIPELLEKSRDEVKEIIISLLDLCKKIYLLDQITIAKINGHATGGGCMIALSTDFRFMINNKSKIALNEINRHVKKETNIFDLSFRFLKKNGNWMWIRGRGKIVQYDKDGKPLRMVGTHTDVTHRMLAEEKVKRAEQRFRALIEKATDGIVINDAEGHIVYASPNSMRHFGYTQEEFAKKPNGSELTHPDDLPMVLEHFNRVAQNPEYSPTIEYRFRKKDGEYRWIETTFTNLLNDPAINGFVLNFRDITERKKAEEELQRISKLESLGVLAGGIAHNFKNILTTMALSAEIAIFKPDKAEKHLNKIIKSIEQASSLATRFQTFSKTDKPIFEPSDINSLIMESAEIALTGSSIVPKFYFDDLIPKMLLDAKRMNEVFTNLLINAKQAMPKGGEIIIRSRINENVNDGVRKSILQVDVIDTGIGIPPENIDDIFNPFFTTKQDGHGLGLATVYNIIKKHQGDIKVESKPNQGTTFSLFLPINKVDSDLQPSDCAKINFDRNVNILILDDNHEIIENMEEMFVDSNITVAGFSDPDLLIMDYANSIDTKKYDLVILDLQQ